MSDISKIQATKRARGFRKAKRREFKKTRNKTDLEEKGFVVHKDGRYFYGSFYQVKNKEVLTFRSGYEFAYCIGLEGDDNVLAYSVEPFSIPYFYRRKDRRYIPDLLVVYADGRLELQEVKPKSQLLNRRVQMKATAARLFLKSLSEECLYRFVTEEEIFESKEHYQFFIDNIKREAR